MWTWLERIDHQQNTNRWYAVGIQPTLLDEIAVIRFWGCRGNTYQQTIIEPFTDLEKAHTRANTLIREKLHRGYQITASTNQSTSSQLSSRACRGITNSQSTHP